MNKIDIFVLSFLDVQSIKANPMMIAFKKAKLLMFSQINLMWTYYSIG